MEEVRGQSRGKRGALRTLLSIAALIARAYSQSRSLHDTSRELETYRDAHAITRRWLEDVEEELARQGMHPSSEERSRRPGQQGFANASGLLSLLQEVATAGWRSTRDRRCDGDSSFSGKAMQALHGTLLTCLADAEREIARLERQVARQSHGPLSPSRSGNSHRSIEGSSRAGFVPSDLPIVPEDLELQEAIHQSLQDNSVLEAPRQVPGDDQPFVPDQTSPTRPLFPLRGPSARPRSVAASDGRAYNGSRLSTADAARLPVPPAPRSRSNRTPPQSGAAVPLEPSSPNHGVAQNMPPGYGLPPTRQPPAWDWPKSVPPQSARGSGQAPPLQQPGMATSTRDFAQPAILSMSALQHESQL